MHCEVTISVLKKKTFDDDKKSFLYHRFFCDKLKFTTEHV